MNLFQREGIDPEVRERLETWTRELLALAEDDRVLIHEVRCPEPLCPPHGTVIAVVYGAGGQAKTEVARPAAAIFKVHLEKALEKLR